MTSKEKKETLKKFIIDNKLEFTVGRRNSDSVILAGFALYIGEKDEAKVRSVIKNILPYVFDFEKEFQEVFEYADRNHYGRFWTKPAAKKQYIF